MFPMFFVGKKPRLQNAHYLHRQHCEILPDAHARIPIDSGKIEHAIEEAEKHFDVIRVCTLCMPQKQTTPQLREAAL